MSWLSKGIKSAGKVAKMAAPFASFIPGVGPLAGAALGALGGASGGGGLKGALMGGFGGYTGAGGKVGGTLGKLSGMTIGGGKTKFNLMDLLKGGGNALGLNGQPDEWLPNALNMYSTYRSGQQMDDAIGDATGAGVRGTQYADDVWNRVNRPMLDNYSQLEGQMNPIRGRLAGMLNGTNTDRSGMLGAYGDTPDWRQAGQDVYDASLSASGVDASNAYQQDNDMITSAMARRGITNSSMTPSLMVGAANKNRAAMGQGRLNALMNRYNVEGNMRGEGRQVTGGIMDYLGGEQARLYQGANISPQLNAYGQLSNTKLNAAQLYGGQANQGSGAMGNYGDVMGQYRAWKESRGNGGGSGGYAGGAQPMNSNISVGSPGGLKNLLAQWQNPMQNVGLNGQMPRSIPPMLASGNVNNKLGFNPQGRLGSMRLG